MKLWHYAVIALAIAGGGYAFGRFQAPTKVIERESTKSAERIRELTEQLEASKRHTVKETTVTFSPTGKPLTKTVREDTHVDRVTDTRRDSDTVRQVEVIKEKIVERDAPRWSLGAVLVIQPRLDPLGAELSAGAMVSRRILGPLWLGLTATVPLKQPISVPTFTLSASVVF